MRKKFKRGSTILSVLVLMSVVICFSLLLFSFTINSKISLKKEGLRVEKKVLIAKIFNDFTDNGIIDHEYSINVNILTSDSNVQQSAVVASKGNKISDLIYFCVYDFLENKTIAEQQDNFYFTIKEFDGTLYYYLADMIRYMEV